MEGHKEVLGFWLSKNEGAKFWMQVVTELNGGSKIFLLPVLMASRVLKKLLQPSFQKPWSSFVLFI